MKFARVFFVLCAGVTITFAFASGCSGKKSARGFRLPDGDVSTGEATFVALNCHSCHTVFGRELPAVDGSVESKVSLGGEVSRIKTYGELVTAVINPSHTLKRGEPKEKVSEDGKSKMPNFNQAMTVQQLIDVVAFLQDRYKIKRHDDLYYPYP